MSKTATKIHLILSIVHVIGALGGFIYLGMMEYHQAAFWSIVSGIFTMANIHLHCLHLTDKIHVWHSPETLSSVKCLAFVSSIITQGVFLWYAFTLFYFYLPFLDPKESDRQMSIAFSTGWSFHSMISSVALYWSAWRYTKIVMEAEREPLLPH